MLVQLTKELNYNYFPLHQHICGSTLRHENTLHMRLKPIFLVHPFEGSTDIVRIDI